LLFPPQIRFATSLLHLLSANQEELLLTNSSFIDMSIPKPIFVATHPRACSTAFERVFMTRRDILSCVHEPFGDAFYFGPERLSERYADNEEAREKSGFAKTTYRDVLALIEKTEEEV
jgi:hypothetical protein